MIQSNEKDEEHSEKEIIKVFVITGPKSSGNTTYETEVNGKKIHSGMAWDVIEAVKKLPSFKKYKFEYTFSKPGAKNYDEILSWVSTGKYDLGLATFSQTHAREEKINYTVPVSIDAFALFHYSNTSHFDIFKDVFFKIGYMIMILVILGIIAGIILFFREIKVLFSGGLVESTTTLPKSIIPAINSIRIWFLYVKENLSTFITIIIVIFVIIILWNYLFKKDKNINN